MDTFATVVRVSHMAGRKAGADSFHADREQLDPIEAWAKGKKVRLDVLPPELGVSGGLPLEQRPSLLHAVEGIERGDYNGLVVAYLSRLGRNVAEQLRVWDRVQAANGQIVVLREGIDTTTASGRLHRNLLLSVDAHEREQHAERFEERRRAATAAGIWQRRQTPTGYRRDKTTRKLVPDRRAGKVRDSFRARGAGETITALAENLGMTKSGVRQLLKNRVYLGELRVGQHVNPAAHPALVTIEEFEAAQRSVARPARSKGPPALLAGLVRCSGCGHVMTRSSGKAPVYGCPEHHSGASCPAPARITITLLDEHVERIALNELARLEVDAHASGHPEQARSAVAAAERELAVYLEAVSAADVGAGAFAAGARGRRDKVEQAKQDLRAELARRPALPHTTGGADVWQTLDARERNVLLRGLIAAVVVARAGGRGARIRIGDRVRVLAAGTELQLPQRNGERAAGIVPLVLPDPDDERVLRVPAGQDQP